jgi:hypothetical protein
MDRVHDPDAALMRRLAKIPCEVCGEPSTNRAAGKIDGHRFDFGVCADHHADVPRLLMAARQ